MGVARCQKKIAQYHLVSAMRLEDFNQAINMNIANGWQPIGEVKFDRDYQNRVCGYFQVIVIYAEGPE
jgi:hypothetical protein